MATYSRLCGNEKIHVSSLPDVWVEGVPFGLYRDQSNNFYCDYSSSEIIKLNAKNYDDARKETIEFVNSF